MLVPSRGCGYFVIAQAEFAAVQIRHRPFTQPVSADRCGEEEYRKSIQQPISMSEAPLRKNMRGRRSTQWRAKFPKINRCDLRRTT
jgi:hypothetical protein